MRLQRHIAHDLIVETNPRTKPARTSEEAVIKSLPPSEPSATRIKCQAGNEDQIEFISSRGGFRAGFQNPEISGQQLFPISYPMEYQPIANNAGQSDPLLPGPGIEWIRFSGQRGKRAN